MMQFLGMPFHFSSASRERIVLKRSGQLGDPSNMLLVGVAVSLFSKSSYVL